MHYIFCIVKVNPFRRKFFSDLPQISRLKKNISIKNMEFKKIIISASEGVQSHHEPCKITSRASRFAEWPSSQSKSTPVVPYATSQSLHNSYSTSSILISNNKHLAFTSTKSLFLKKSQNDQKVFQRRPHCYHVLRFTLIMFINLIPRKYKSLNHEFLCH